MLVRTISRKNSMADKLSGDRGIWKFSKEIRRAEERSPFESLALKGPIEGFGKSREADSLHGI